MSVRYWMSVSSLYESVCMLAWLIKGLYGIQEEGWKCLSMYWNFNPGLLKVNIWMSVLLFKNMHFTICIPILQTSWHLHIPVILISGFTCTVASKAEYISKGFQAKIRSEDLCYNVDQRGLWTKFRSSSFCLVPHCILDFSRLGFIGC